MSLPTSLRESSLGQMSLPTSLRESSLGQMSLPTSLRESSLGQMSLPPSLIVLSSKPRSDVTTDQSQRIKPKSDVTTDQSYCAQFQAQVRCHYRLVSLCLVPKTLHRSALHSFRVNITQVEQFCVKSSLVFFYLYMSRL